METGGCPEHVRRREGSPISLLLSVAIAIRKIRRLFYIIRYPRDPGTSSRDPSEFFCRGKMVKVHGDEPEADTTGMQDSTFLLRMRDMKKYTGTGSMIFRNLPVAI